MQHQENFGELEAMAVNSGIISSITKVFYRPLYDFGRLARGQYFRGPYQTGIGKNANLTTEATECIEGAEKIHEKFKRG